MDPIIDELVKVLGAALASALTALVIQLLRKQNIELSAERQAQLESIARHAILVVEERSAAALKAGLRKMTPAEKLAAGVSVFVSKAPGVSDEEAREIVEAQLPVVRGAAVSFATAVLKAATSTGGRK